MTVVMSVCSYFLLKSSLEPQEDTQYDTSISFPKYIPPEVIIKPQKTWHSYNIQQGTTLSMIFKELNLPVKTLYEILKLGKITKPLESIRPNTSFEYALNDKLELIQLEYQINHQKKLQVTLVENKFVAKTINTQIEQRLHYSSGTIQSTLSHATTKAGLSNKLTIEMASILGWNINFKKDLRPGDTFTIMYEDFYAGDTKVKNGSILAIQFLNKNKLYQAVRFTRPNGSHEYFKANGQSLRTAFIRRPVKYTRISDHFNTKRKHPILKIVRKHAGTDYAAPQGTPIVAAGDGVISFIGRKGGYGRAIKIRHGHIYASFYAHLSKYNKNIKKGIKVNKGDVIGYVGKSGLADGPHLHYEFHIRGKQVDPEKVQLPMTRSLYGKEKKQFLKLALPIQAQLALYHRAYLNKKIA